MVHTDLFNFWVDLKCSIVIYKQPVRCSIAPCRPEFYVDQNKTTPAMLIPLQKQLPFKVAAIRNRKRLGEKGTETRLCMESFSFPTLELTYR